MCKNPAMPPFPGSREQAADNVMSMPVSAAAARQVRNTLILENLPLVGYLVSDAVRRAAGAVSRDELASAGFLGLVSAAEAYSSDRGVPFGAYARIRITGALVDEMRSTDWAGRGARKRMKETRAAQDTLTATLGRSPSIEETATLLGVDPEAVKKAVADSDRSVISLEDSHGLDPVDLDLTPEELLLASEARMHLLAGIRALPPRIRLVIEQVYLQGRTVTDVALEAGLTHSAVSQARAQGVSLLRDSLSAYEPPTSPVVPSTAISAGRRDSYLESVAKMTQGGIANRHSRSFLRTG